MAKRVDRDEHYVMDLCDEVLGSVGVRQHTFPWLLGDLSSTTGRSRKLPVDGYWPSHNLVIEFHEKQHTEAVPIFDRRATVSGVTQGVQRRLYDERKATLIPENGIRFVVIDKSGFVVRSSRIVRDRERDLEIVRRHLSGQ